MRKRNNIVCSFYRKCINYERECNHCKWNAACDVSDYLVLKTDDGKTIRHLRSTNGLS